MDHFFIYATKVSSMELLQKEIEHAFKISFSKHESGWFGEYVLWQGDKNEAIKIYPNYVVGEGYHEKEFKEFPFLIEISCFENPDEIKRIISSANSLFELVRYDEI